MTLSWKLFFPFSYDSNTLKTKQHDKVTVLWINTDQRDLYKYHQLVYYKHKSILLGYYAVPKHL